MSSNYANTSSFKKLNRSGVLWKRHRREIRNLGISYGRYTESIQINYVRITYGSAGSAITNIYAKFLFQSFFQHLHWNATLDWKGHTYYVHWDLFKYHEVTSLCIHSCGCWYFFVLQSWILIDCWVYQNVSREYWSRGHPLCCRFANRLSQTNQAYSSC